MPKTITISAATNLPSVSKAGTTIDSSMNNVNLPQATINVPAGGITGYDTITKTATIVIANGTIATISFTNATAGTGPQGQDQLTGCSTLTGAGSTLATGQSLTWGTDQTPTIQSQMNTAAAGDVISFPVGASAGLYRCDTPLNAPAVDGVTIRGPNPNNQAVWWSPLNGVQLGLVSNGISQREHFIAPSGPASGPFIKNILVYGSNTYAGDGYGTLSSTYEPEHGFLIRTPQFTIEDCAATLVHGDGVSLQAPSGTAGPIYGNIRRFVATGVGRDGYTLTKAHQILIEGFINSKGAASVTDLEPNAGGEEPVGDGVSNVEIRNGGGNNGHDVRKGAYSAQSQRPVVNVWIHDEFVINSGAGLQQVLLSNFDGVSAGSCRIERVNYGIVGNAGNQQAPPFSIHLTTYISIKDCNITCQVGTAYCIGFTSVSGYAEISNNVFTAASQNPSLLAGDAQPLTTYGQWGNIINGSVQAKTWRPAQ
jgi:hypothetical protein